MLSRMILCFSNFLITLFMTDRFGDLWRRLNDIHENNKHNNIAAASIDFRNLLCVEAKS